MGMVKQQELLRARLLQQAIIAEHRAPSIWDKLEELITGQVGNRFCLAVLVFAFAYLGGHIIYWLFWLR